MCLLQVTRIRRVAANQLATPHFTTWRVDRPWGRNSARGHGYTTRGKCWMTRRLTRSLVPNPHVVDVEVAVIAVVDQDQRCLLVAKFGDIPAHRAQRVPTWQRHAAGTYDLSV